MDRTISAKEFLARDYAGLVLTGFDEDGYVFVGNERAWEASAINEADETFPHNEYGLEMRWSKHN